MSSQVFHQTTYYLEVQSSISVSGSNGGEKDKWLIQDIPKDGEMRTFYHCNWNKGLSLEFLEWYQVQ